MVNVINREELKKILDNFTTWSYSRVNSYKICPKMFYLTYIEKLKGDNGVFAQFGIYAHQIMEYYNKGEISEWELADYYRDNYSKNITLDFPPNRYIDLSKSYYDSGLEFLENFDGYKDKTIGAESKFEFEIIDEKRNKIIPFTGIIDRISEDNNGIVLNDYKSKKKFGSKREMAEYFRQMYIYSIPIFEKYGKYPYLLRFYFFRDFNNIPETLFDENEFQKSKDFVCDTIEEIYNEEEFAENYNDFFCKYICSVPCGSCDCKKQESWY